MCIRDSLRIVSALLSRLAAPLGGLPFAELTRFSARASARVIFLSVGGFGTLSARHSRPSNDSLATWRQPSSGSHMSFVQGSPSKQFRSAYWQPPFVASQLSTVQALLSLQLRAASTLQNPSWQVPMPEHRSP